LEGRKAWFVWHHLTVIVNGSIRQPFIYVVGGNCLRSTAGNGQFPSWIPWRET
jgi:hypothetical protein